MDWKSRVLKTFRFRVILLGAVGGLWGGALQEWAGFLSGMAVSHSLTPLFSGAMLGLGLGLCLAPTEHLIDRFFKRAWRSAFAGGLGGMIIGALGFQGLYQLSLWGDKSGAGLPLPILIPWVFFPLLMGLLGAVIGWASGLSTSKGGLSLPRTRTGLICGFAMAYPLVLIQIHLNDSWLMLAGLAIWGMVLGVGVFWLEKRMAKRWFRLLTGPGEDRLFPLRGGFVTLGKNEKNDIPLLRFNEIYPFHCRLRWQDGQFLIGEVDQGGMVWVNYREAMDHPLKSGDLIKIGTALLQYGETP